MACYSTEPLTCLRHVSHAQSNSRSQLSSSGTISLLRQARTPLAPVTSKKRCRRWPSWVRSSQLAMSSLVKKRLIRIACLAPLVAAAPRPPNRTSSRKHSCKRWHSKHVASRASRVRVGVAATITEGRLPRTVRGPITRATSRYRPCLQSLKRETDAVRSHLWSSANLADAITSNGVVIA